MSAAHSAARPKPEAPQARGLIQRVLPERGYGFIRCTEGGDGTDIGTDFFFHISGLKVAISELREGVLVTFLPTHPPKGPRAEDIERVA